MTHEEILGRLNRVRSTIQQYLATTSDSLIVFYSPNAHYKLCKKHNYSNDIDYYLIHGRIFSPPGFSGGYASGKFQNSWYIGDSLGEVFRFLIVNGIQPKINNKIDRGFDLIRELYQKGQITFCFIEGNNMVMAFTKQCQWMLIYQVLEKYDMSQNETVSPSQENSEPQPQTEKKMNLELQALLECDKKRIGVAAYDKRRFTNPEQGHWDIQEKDGKKIGDDTFYSRNPKKDIKEGVVGIDFGTRSTVVCYQDENSVRIPMPIGDNGSKEIGDKRYENPTIMCFASLSKFMEAYKASQGRPSTDWNDLYVSHLAKQNFKDASGNDFIAYLDNIKSWALGRNRKTKIKPTQEEKVYDLKPFLEVGDEDFNPVEYYAYFIGSYINDMVKGIHLHYYLSFPATVENAVREKIRKSFENGIRKSLPTQILDDEGIMKKFYVNGDCSEPLAYAACALQEYGFTFEDDNQNDVNYAIFDFGGGTTDYNFGIWKASGNDNYDYEIETFGSNGLPKMGGENLLEDLAFEIFKANLNGLTKEQKDKQKERNIQFCYGPNSQIFPEADRYISQSMEADKNMHVMMEKLREYWENSEEKLKKGEGDEEIKFDQDQFYCKGDGEMAQGFNISTTKTFMRDFFCEKIRNAVRNFFTALKKIQGYEGNQDIKIFLAGNACKSPYVAEMFEDERTKLEKEGYNFEIFPPLGTDKANEIIAQRHVQHSTSEVRPTGKTGVAFGLIETQKGGRIKISRKQSEDQFAFYIGTVSKHKFRHFDGKGTEMKVEGKPDLNQWYEFRQMEEGDTMCKLYYTNLPECIEDQLSETSTKNVVCEFDDEVDENGANVYIRAISSDSIEFLVTNEGMPDNTDTKVKKRCKTITLN